MDIRELTSNDFVAAFALENAAHAFPWSATLFQQSLQNRYWRWALWEKEALVAIAFFQVVTLEVELLNLAVDPSCQGRGLGRLFLESLLDQFTAKRLERCFLEVRASNIAAIKLYEGLGFNQMGIRPGYYPAKNGREDAYLYALELACD
jgi:ribosomal-protein-alanine N-acetyltransferase